VLETLPLLRQSLKSGRLALFAKEQTPLTFAIGAAFVLYRFHDQLYQFN